MDPAKRKSTEIIAGLIALILFVTVYLTVLKLFLNESEKRYSVVIDKAGLGPDYLNVEVIVTGVDPIKGELSARLLFEPEGALKGSDNLSVGQDLMIYVNSIKGKQVEVLKKGHRPTPMEVTLVMYGGEATHYPFDHHTVDLDIAITTPAKAEPPAPQEKPAPPPSTDTNPEGGSKEPPKETPKETPKKEEKGGAPSIAQLLEGDPIKTAIGVDASVTGFNIDATKSSEAPDVGYTGIDLQIGRTFTVVAFSMFILACFWSLTIVILSMTFQVVFRERKVEFAMFTFMAGMLFAFPAVRNLQPGIPPLGSLTDFLSVFWAQGIIVGCILALIVVWIKRK